MRRWWLLLAAGVALGTAAVALVWSLNLQDEDAVPADGSRPVVPVAATPALIAQGAYLARAGNCMSCHTARGGVPYAGGRGIATPFGTVFTSNLTPDETTGIGSWSPAHFWRALHNGRSKDGRLLYPAFPYTSTTQVSRADSDALYAYLRSVPAVRQANTPHALRWPYSTQAALAVWRVLYFKPQTFLADSRRSAEWNRGAYLVRGLGHCSACHTARNALGASEDRLDLAGGLIPMQNWYAPSLTLGDEAGVANWDTRHIVALLKTGVSPQASTTGPMAEVVLNSTQYLSDGDLTAMATFLKALPQVPSQSAAPGAPPPRVSERGAKLYEQHCAQCHGERGEGVAGAYPVLAGNRAVTLASTANLVQIVLHGGFAPATAGNPRPFGMPPYLLQLNDSDVAAVLSHLRSAWGNQAPRVTEFEVSRWRDPPSR
jgi:mono/diheme cytochrome c family protein